MSFAARRSLFEQISEMSLKLCWAIFKKLYNVKAFVQDVIIFMFALPLETRCDKAKINSDIL